jgi:hypothetical protein
LAGMVVYDQYCGVNPRAYLIDIGRHQEWIWRISASPKMNVMMSLITICAVVAKFLV